MMWSVFLTYEIESIEVERGGHGTFFVGFALGEVLVHSSSTHPHEHLSFLS